MGINLYLLNWFYLSIASQIVLLTRSVYGKINIANTPNKINVLVNENSRTTIEINAVIKKTNEEIKYEIYIAPK
jgi:hypothetical protein